jgi:putative component of toxin-antitoxin plasmid stabilization module
MDEMTVDEFLDMVVDLRSRMKVLEKRITKLEQDSWGDLESIDDDDYSSK